MAGNRYKVVKKDGSVAICNGTKAAALAQVSPMTISHNQDGLYRSWNGATVQLLYSVTARRYRIKRGTIVFSDLRAGEVGKYIGCVPRTVSTYAKLGIAFNGWSITIEPPKVNSDIAFQKTTAFACFDCVFCHDETGCRSHKCRNPKGYYKIVNL